MTGWQKERRSIIDSREGCECPNVDSGGVLLTRDERCDKKWVRCNGVLRRREEKLAALGPKPADQFTRAADGNASKGGT